MDLSQLNAISPVDGRYGSKTAALRPIFSEFGLIRHRVIVEVRWLQALANHPGIAEVPALGGHAEHVLNDIIENFNYRAIITQMVKNNRMHSASRTSKAPPTTMSRQSSIS